MFSCSETHSSQKFLLTRSKHTKGSEKYLLIMTRTQSVNFWGNPLYQASKRHTVKWLKTKTMKNEMGSEITCIFGVELLFSCPVHGRMIPPSPPPTNISNRQEMTHCSQFLEDCIFSHGTKALRWKTTSWTREKENTVYTTCYSILGRSVYSK